MRFWGDGSKGILFFYWVLLFWVPIPLGSNRAWSAALLEVWVLVLLMAWMAGFMSGRYPVSPTLLRARAIWYCAVAWLVFVWLQLLPIPIELLGLISPEAAHAYRQAAAPDAVGWAPLTLDRQATLEGACKTTAYIAFFALSLFLLNTRDRIRTTTYVLIFSGVFQALYGVFSSYQGGVPASGTYVNRNHYAGYLEMCLSVGIGVLMASLSGERNETWGHFFRRMVQWMISPKMGLRLLLVTMVIALVLSRSRMGNSAFFVSLFATGIIGLMLSRHATRSMVVLLISLMVIDVAIVGTYFGAERVVERISDTSMQTEDRDEVAGYALRMWRDYPLLGAGLGAFGVVFPRYSADGTNGTYTHAHNDFFEFGAETGLLGLILLGFMVGSSLLVALRAQYLCRDPVLRGISFAALMGILSLMIHSAVDFNLQIPANALTFMLLLAFAWISYLHSNNELLSGD
jgi:O-antigen ligase